MADPVDITQESLDAFISAYNKELDRTKSTHGRLNKYDYKAVLQGVKKFLGSLSITHYTDLEYKDPPFEESVKMGGRPELPMGKVALARLREQFLDEMAILELKKTKADLEASLDRITRILDGIDAKRKRKD